MKLVPRAVALLAIVGALVGLDDGVHAGMDPVRSLDVLDAQKKSVQADVARIEPELALVRMRMAARGRAYAKATRSGILPAAAGAQAFAEHLIRIGRLRQGLRQDLEREQALLSERKKSLDALAWVEDQRAPLEVQRTALEQAQVALREAEDRRAAFGRAFEGQGDLPSYALYGSSTGPVSDASSGTFATLKGRLVLPITGRAEVKRTRRPGAGGPGVLLIAPASAVVRSVAEGRVAFADAYSDYGLTIILDHGGGYFSLYAGLGDRDVEVGDLVPASSRLGRMSAGDAKHGLYFELRRGGDTIDPTPWLGL